MQKQYKPQHIFFAAFIVLGMMGLIFLPFALLAVPFLVLAIIFAITPERFHTWENWRKHKEQKQKRADEV